ncbi:MAG: RDD family protein [Polyangiaceae bacterium]|nr:RDD family protein [Polyangiaceae bacterium]
MSDPAAITRLRIDVETPEHVSLPFEVAPLSARFLALLIDALVISGVLLALGLVALAFFLMVGADGGAYIGALLLVAGFLVRNFYFAFCELRWEGRTVGKRAQGIRVIARDGGGLTADMVFARNLTRDLELFMPAIVLMFPEAVLGGASGWVRGLCALWLLVLALLPFFNRHRARMGDLVAGTVVVVTPRATLMPDLVATVARPERRAPELVFTNAQLDIYGIEELQVLEDVLRGEVTTSVDLYESIAERIQRKIGWDRSRRVPAEAFLRAFYEAQRARLEQKMLLGKRQERKIR